MKLYKSGDKTVVDGEMSAGGLYITPKDSKYWLQAKGVSNLFVTNWNSVIPEGSNRIVRFIKLIPHVWRACK